MTAAQERRGLSRRGIAWLRAAAPTVVGLPLATAVTAVGLSSAANAAPLVGVKRALFVVGWFAVGVASFVMWRRMSPARNGSGESTRVDLQTVESAGRRGGNSGRPALETRLVVAGVAALVASVVLESGLGVGG